MPGKGYAPIVQEAGWPPVLIWTAAENITLPVIDPQTIQHILNHCTNNSL